MGYAHSDLLTQFAGQIVYALDGQALPDWHVGGRVEFDLASFADGAPEGRFRRLQANVTSFVEVISAGPAVFLLNDGLVVLATTNSRVIGKAINGDTNQNRPLLRGWPSSSQPAAW